MAQHDMNIANQGFPAFRSDLNNALSAIQTNHSGTSRPTGAVAGQIWLDTTSATSPTLKFFDGTDDISLATIDYSANTVNWLDSTVSITGLTSTASATVLTLQDTNVEVSGGSTQGGEVRFKEDSDTGSNYTALKAGNPASNVTFILPTADGSADQILKTDGSGNLSFADASAGGTSWQAVKTGAFTAVAGEGYFCNTTSSAFTATLPTSASQGDEVSFIDYAGTFDTNNLTVGRNSHNIQGDASDLTISTERAGFTLVYVDATVGWLLRDK